MVHIVGMGELPCRVGTSPTPPLMEGDVVVVNVNHGLDDGVVKEVAATTVSEGGSGLSFVRRATAEDLRQIAANAVAAKEALNRITAKIRENRILFKPLDAHYSLNRDRLSILFGSEEEVDLKRLFALIPVDIRARIEFRQVGIRDECALLGGIGPCGRVFCCCSWQKYFNPVHIHMAKMQEMPLTPTAINGACGRLKCCLRFEYEQYCEAAEGLPTYGTIVEGEGIRGEVIGRDVLRGHLTVRTQNGQFLRLPYAQLKIARRDTGQSSAPTGKSETSVREGESGK